MHDLQAADPDELADYLRAKPRCTFDGQTAHLIAQAQYLFHVRLVDPVVFSNLIPCTWVTKDGEAPRALDRIVERIDREFGEQANQVQTLRGLQLVLAIASRRPASDHAA